MNWVGCIAALLLLLVQASSAFKEGNEETGIILLILAFILPFILYFTAKIAYIVLELLADIADEPRRIQLKQEEAN